MLCRKCNGDFDSEQFRWADKKKGIRYKWCKPCHYEYEKTRKESSPEKRAERLASYINQEGKYRKAIYTRITEYLLKHPCIDCGNGNPLVLQFDHLCDKLGDISQMVKRRKAWSSIEQEIKKCEVRCANCHQIKTAHGNKWYKVEILRILAPQYVAR